MRIAVIDDLKSDRQLLISRLNKLLSDNSINGEIYEFEKGIDFIIYGYLHRYRKRNRNFKTA